ncbi:MAG TPA: GHKL domain-containing protein [Oligoflexus sp.]|uniref:sensor histidine kinase n=1 Tax=Oligoflexus sp. TaxID=1971216 RepID=UPI002D7F6C20|nr:GHKL domain-containing protein [Oligoflexus sp.]HET9238278.1 GHKL domain-containing protein [Oligoflexus sp.]
MKSLGRERVHKLLSLKHDEFRRLFLLFSTRLGILVATFMFGINCFVLGTTHPVTVLLGLFGILLFVLQRFFSQPTQLQQGCIIMMSALIALVLAVPILMRHDLSGAFFFMPVAIMMAAFLFDIRAATYVLAIMLVYNMLFTAGWLSAAFGLDVALLHNRPWASALDRMVSCVAAFLVSMGFLQLKKQHEEMIMQQHEELALQKTLNSLGTMANGIAHELNNPLAIAQGANYILKKLTKDHGEWDKWLKSSEDALDRMAAVVKAMEVFSGRLNAEDAVRLEPRAYIESKLKSFETEQRIPPGLLTWDLAPEGDILMRETHLNVILQNLLINAWEATQKMEQPGIALRSWMTPEHYCLELSNSAQPLDADTLDKLFDPFFTTKKVGDGPGLGLTIVYGLVGNYGGLIATDYSDSRFVVRLSLPRYDALKDVA